MATATDTAAAEASECPFRIDAIRSKPGEPGFEQYQAIPCQNGIFYLQEQREYTVTLQKQQECTVTVLSDDPNMRLYLPGLDIPVSQKEDTDRYKKASDGTIVLFQRNEESKDSNGKKVKTYEPLRVGTYRAKVVCNEKEYGTWTIQVLPNEDLWQHRDESPYPKDPEWALRRWEQMRAEVEGEAQGLAQDMVRFSLGLKADAGDLTAEKLYRFHVMKHYSSRVLGALLGIQRAPKNRLVTHYAALPRGSSGRADAVSLRLTAAYGTQKQCIYVPQKQITYDVPENRLLKKVITFYDRELSDFCRCISNDPVFHQGEPQYTSELYYLSRQYTAATAQNLDRLRTEAEKLRKISGVIKNQPWYDQVRSVPTAELNHAAAMDPRYNTLMQMYRALQKENSCCKAEEEQDVSWKKSDEIFEMWCFLKAYRAFRNQTDWHLDMANGLKLDNGEVFPKLAPGTALCFSCGSYELDGKPHALTAKLIYNGEVGINARKGDDPFFFIQETGKKGHKLPDIRIDLYDRIKGENDPGKYFGTLILECKYRKTDHFWDHGQRSDRAKWSSQEQLRSYYSNACSAYGYFVWLDGPVRPALSHPAVKQVTVLTPDEREPQNHVPPFIKLLTLRPDLKNPENVKDPAAAKLWKIIKGFIDDQLSTGFFTDHPESK